MGGWGSGRPGQHGVLERRLRLDVRVFRRRGWLVLSGRGLMRWSDDGEETASGKCISFEEEGERHADQRAQRYSQD